ncbi:hypothetical protein PHMEG_00018501 [Phytophthora megakarya]|uniref:Uncharacterized protein n=1 Tax=Phytophthora megakarya TaxID=4795 RepID=A0A225VVG4_9STRA|nr:hypothetical protein PHMEG_00018501 [Phytophthora megakarya]
MAVARRSGLDLAQFVEFIGIKLKQILDLFKLTVSTKSELNQLTTQWNSIVRLVLYPRGNQTDQPDSSRDFLTLKVPLPIASKYEITYSKANKKDTITSWKKIY